MLIDDKLICTFPTVERTFKYFWCLKASLPVLISNYFHMISGAGIRSVKINFIKGYGLTDLVHVQHISFFSIFLSNKSENFLQQKYVTAAKPCSCLTLHLLGKLHFQFGLIDFTAVLIQFFWSLICNQCLRQEMEFYKNLKSFLKEDFWGQIGIVKYQNQVVLTVAHS